MPISLLFLMTVIAAAEPIVPPDAKVEQVATGFRFTEGPALAPDGSIYFTDIPSNRIHRYDPRTGETFTVFEDSGGANGLAFAGDWFYACEGKRRQVVRRELVRNGYGEMHGIAMHAQVIGERFEGKRLNSPNDLAIDDAGNVWFTDPRYGKRDDLELERECVYRIGADGALQLASDKATKPNGIAFVAKLERLYIADNAGKRLLQMSLNSGATAPFASVDGPGGPDGMTIDRVGNVYAAWHGGGGVHVWNPGGEHIGFIATPEEPTNCTFAADGRTLYITAGKSLYRVVINVPAVEQAR